MNEQDREFAKHLKSLAEDESYVAYWAKLWAKRYGRSFIDFCSEIGCDGPTGVLVTCERAPRGGRIVATFWRDCIAIARNYNVSAIGLASVVLLCHPMTPRKPGPALKKRRDNPHGKESGGRHAE